MKESTFSILASGDNFLDFKSPPVKITTAPRYKPPEPIYEVGYGDVSSKIPKTEYKLFKNVGIVLISGALVIAIFLLVWYFTTNFRRGFELTQSGPTTATEISVFMQDVNVGGFTTIGTASSIRTSQDCPENNCVELTTFPITLNCITGPEGVVEWLGRDCQLPNIPNAPYKTSLPRLLTENVRAFGESIGTIDPDHDGVYYTPYEIDNILGQITTSPKTRAVLYDTKDRLENGKYKTYFVLPNFLGGEFLDLSTVNTAPSFSGGIVELPDLFTDTVFLMINDLRYTYYGENLVMLNFDVAPELTYFILPNNTNVFAMDITSSTSNTITFNSGYSIYNANQHNVEITSNTVDTIVNNIFIPYTLPASSVKITVSS